MRSTPDLITKEIPKKCIIKIIVIVPVDTVGEKPESVYKMRAIMLETFMFSTFRP